jgi:hypothetical protein
MQASEDNQSSFSDQEDVYSDSQMFDWADTFADKGAITPQ